MSQQQTALPPPTEGNFDEPAPSPYAKWPHMHQLRRELAALVEDLDPQWAPVRGGEEGPAWAESMVRSGYRRLMVGVYAPRGRDEVMLGWFPKERLREVIDRCLAYLPGSRELNWGSNAADSLAVAWGSRDPGWTPTAIWVRKWITGEWREPEDLWDAEQCAEYCGISPATWRSYVSRQDAGAPTAFGDAHRPGVRRPVTVWERQQVVDWHQSRPGKGGRPRQGDR